MACSFNYLTKALSDPFCLLKCFFPRGNGEEGGKGDFLRGGCKFYDLQKLLPKWLPHLKLTNTVTV